MHIYEGVLTVTTAGKCVLAAGAVFTAAGTGIALYRMKDEQIPKVAVLSAAFFVISTIQVPLGPTSVHLVLFGLMGLVLGWSAFPAVLIALLLQAVFLGIGGAVNLGVNTLNMALPAVMCHYLYRRAVRSNSETMVFSVGFLAGATAVLAAAVLIAASLRLGGRQYEFIAAAVAVLHLPLLVVEGLVTGSVVLLLRKVQPELLDAPLLVASAQEVSRG